MWVAPLNVDLLRLALAEPANEGSNAMPPTDLNVPFHEKDDAKRLGARWDAVRKTWFLLDCTDTAPFARWLPQQSDINLRCTSYFIAQSVRACWHCDRDSHVFSFLLPRGHQTRQDSDESAQWEPQESEAIIYYITQIPESVQVQMRSVTGHYRKDFSKTTQSFYWMNHCEHCAAKLGDFDTNNEFGVGFDPASAAQAASIRLREILEPFAASCGCYTCGVELFQHMNLYSASGPPQGKS